MKRRAQAKALPDVAVERIPLARIKPAPYNPRDIDTASLKGLGASISEFGLVEPLVWNKRTGNLVGGHQRLKVLTSMKAKDALVVVVDLDPAREKALNVELNNRSIQGRWTEGLGLVLPDIKTELPDFYQDGLLVDLESIVGDLEAAGGKATHPETDGAEAQAEEEIPELPKAPRTKRGDLWILGRHRLLCGDTSKKADVERLLGGKTVDAVVTDPPYAIYGSSTGISSDIADDKMVRPFFEMALRTAHASLKVYGHAYVFCDWRSWASWWEVSKGCGLTPKNMVVWDKGKSGMGWLYANCHELVGFWSKMPKAKTMTSGTRKTSGDEGGSLVPNVFRCSRPTREQKHGHNASKPVELLEFLIGNSTKDGERVADFFGGSGSTMMAAENKGRACLTMEMEPGWCDVSISRWEKFTGKKAKRS